MEQKYRALCETDRARLLKSPMLCSLPVSLFFLRSPWSQPAGSCPGRQPVRGAQTSLESRKYGARIMSFRTTEIISPKNVRSSARAHRNVPQPCPRPKRLNNIGLRGPARPPPLPGPGHGYISVEPGYLGYRDCTWSYAYRYSLRAVAARAHHKGFVLWTFPNLFKYAPPPSVLCSHSGQTLFECTPQLPRKTVKQADRQIEIGPKFVCQRANCRLR